MKRKLSHSEQMAANRKGERDWAAAFKGISGKPVRPEDMEPLPRNAKRDLLAEIARSKEHVSIINGTYKPKKTAAQLPKRSEGDVQRDILSLLHRHPKVAMVKRINSGAMQTERGFVKFNRVRVKGQRDVRMVDIECLLKNGKTFAVEVKEPEWKPPPWEILETTERFISEQNARELGQKRYLDLVIKSGGIGIFATDVSDVINALEKIS